MEDKHLPITGGCLCGAIRYECTEPASTGGYCHCTTCQKGYGGLHGAWLALPVAALRFTSGDPKYYQSSENTRRGFCSGCGSPLVMIYDGSTHPGVNVGSLDRPEDWPLNQEGYWGHSYVGSKVSWEVIADGMPQHETYPGGGIIEAALAYKSREKNGGDG